MSQPVSDLERNKAVVRRYKEYQGTKDEGAAVREILAPGYVRLRGGLAHLANNARDQGFPGPGRFLREAFPDRIDVIEDIVAEADRLGMLPLIDFRVAIPMAVLRPEHRCDHYRDHDDRNHFKRIH